MSDEMTKENQEHKDYSIKNYINNFTKICRTDDGEFERLEEEERQKKLKKEEEQRTRYYKEESGAPSRYWNESLDTYRPSEGNNKTYSWIRGFVTAVKKSSNSKNLVYISGCHGTGKTHLGCGIVRELEGYYTSSYKLCLDFDSCRDFNSKLTRSQFVEKICKKPVLVIDEVGKGIEGIENSLLPFIVNEFYANGNILFMLGNSDKQEFQKLIKTDGVDRMKEVGVYLTLTGNSWRSNESHNEN